jgi:lipoprotein NlpD
MRGCAGLALIAAISVFLAACATVERPAPAPAPVDDRYVVQTGDTLYSISFRRGLDYHDVARWNGIGNDYRIAVGQRLVLHPPGVAVPTPVVRAPPSVVRKAAPPSASPTPQLPPVPVTEPPVWSWPADGRALGTITQPLGGLGLRIGGEVGAPVRAAAAGRVVYVGAGLRAYGLLVIVKHDETWLTAYGYNREVRVKEGDRVQTGDTIASMGEGPAHEPMLYFEIRRNGKPIDPLQALPPRG